MVEDSKIDRLSSPGQLARRAMVGGARTGVAAGVVVSQDDTGAAQPCGIDDNLTYRDSYGSKIAFIALDMEAACRLIDMGDPQPFA